MDREGPRGWAIAHIRWCGGQCMALQSIHLGGVPRFACGILAIYRDQALTRKPGVLIASAPSLSARATACRRLEDDRLGAASNSHIRDRQMRLAIRGSRQSRQSLIWDQMSEFPLLDVARPIEIRRYALRAQHRKCHSCGRIRGSARRATPRAQY